MEEQKKGKAASKKTTKAKTRPKKLRKTSIGVKVYSMMAIIGAVFLIPVIWFLDAKGLSRKPATGAERKKLLIAGISCGAALCVATNLQQIGINLGAGAGKAGKDHTRHHSGGCLPLR